MTDSASARLVEGRECAACNVCCVALTIREPTLFKPQGIVCPNALTDGRCGIYARRPTTCRTFYCGWRQVKWIAADLRPDRSGVLFRVSGDQPAGGRARFALTLTLLNDDALLAPGLVPSLVAAVAAAVPLYLHVPGPPAHTASKGRIDEALSLAARAGDAAMARDFLNEALKAGLAAPRVPLAVK